MVAFSIGLDSWYYGQLAVPQFNFVYVNVVENISRVFGVEPFTFYLEDLWTIINPVDKNLVSLIGLALITTAG